MDILWKGAVSAKFLANRPKLCENCAFPQNFYTMKVGESTVFFAVQEINAGLTFLGKAGKDDIKEEF